MNQARVLKIVAVAALLAAPGAVLADGSGPDKPTLTAASFRAVLAEAGSRPGLSLQARFQPSATLGRRSGSTTRLFREVSRNLEKESRRDTLNTTQAFLSVQWSAEDDYMTEFRSDRAENLLTDAVDELVDDQLDRTMERLPGLRRMSRLVDKLEKFDILSLHWKPDPADPAGPAAVLPQRSGFDGSVKLRVDLNPKLRLNGSWAGFTGRLDLSLTGEPMRVRLNKSLSAHLSAQMESRIPLRGEESGWTTLGFSILF